MRTTTLPARISNNRPVSYFLALCVSRELVRSETLRETSARGLRYQLGRKVHTCCAAACLDEGRLCQTSAVAPHLIDVDSGRAMRTADLENNEGSRPSSRSGVFEALGQTSGETYHKHYAYSGYPSDRVDRPLPAGVAIALFLKHVPLPLEGSPPLTVADGRLGNGSHVRQLVGGTRVACKERPTLDKLTQ